MKASKVLYAIGFLYAIGLAQLGLAVPVPATSLDAISYVPGKPGRLARVTRPPILRHLTSVSTVTDAEEYVGQKIGFKFNNRPVSPSENIPPSLALVAPQPLKTTYLLSLSAQLRSGKERVLDVVGDGTSETIECCHDSILCALFQKDTTKTKYCFFRLKCICLL
ncbi:hypothetical protein CDEST_15431 [Colletotrichum destructivum]|uniref:Uncharacterized protein n=1 Tax=Colletotrichum destructivum TaxID=34406 RepID=A0AAX4J4W1_9PEZI|nr:hypothetical protein CDEST_15431 [Colletotrichum destructivum]